MKSLGKTFICLAALAAAAVGVATPASGASRTAGTTTHVDPYLAGRLRTLTGAAEVHVVINGDTLEHALAAAKAAGVRPGATMDRLGVVVGVGTPAAVRNLVGRQGVDWIGDADQPMQLQLDTSHRATRAAQAAGAFTNPSTGKAYDGTGIGIMIIDGGVDDSHPMFMKNGVSKVRRNMETVPLPLIFTNGPPVGDGTQQGDLIIDEKGTPNHNTDDTAGHGDHVSSIAAGYPVVTKAGHHLVGAAPGATLYSISVATSDSTYYGALAAQSWTMEHAKKPCGRVIPTCPPIRVVNNSYGPIGGGAYDPASPTVEAMQISIAESGVVWVWSAGNDGGDGSSDVTGPSAKEQTPGVLSVANYDDGNAGNRDNALDSSSSRGAAANPATWPDISAPGTDIEAACRVQYSLCAPDLLTDTDTLYGRMTGTSMAAPHIAGYVADILSARPLLTPAQVENLLEDTAHKFTAGAAYAADPTNTDNSSSFDKGHGLVDVTAAFAQLLGVSDPAPIDYCAGVTTLTDAKGDATDAGVQALVATHLPGRSDPATDITSATAALVGTNVRFGVKVADLGPNPSLGSQGDYVRYDFSAGSSNYELILQREKLPGSAMTTTFSLTKEVLDPTTGLTNNVEVASGPAVFNQYTNEAFAVVPASALGSPPAGSRLANVTILWQREVGLLTLTADTARSICGLSI
jgi:serine protease AprX